MKTFHPIHLSASAIINGFILSCLVCAFPSLANEVPIKPIEDVKVLEIPKGNLQDLGGPQERNTQQWQWGVGKDYEANHNQIEYQVNPNTLKLSPSLDYQKDEQDWQNLHRGDPKQTGGNFPFAKF
jgi:hypothetical protein